MAKSSYLGKFITVAVLVAAAGGGYFAWKRADSKPPEITSVTVSRGDLIQSITATGVLQAPTSVDVSSQISGQISVLNVDYNSPVKKGDVLAKIDPASYESRLRQAQAQLANAKANFDVISINAQRTRSLRSQNLVAQQDLDQIEAQLTQADAQLKIQQANVENAQVDLSRCTIYAPIDGIVLDRQCDIGKTVAANFNAPTLFTLVTDLSQMQINADVAEADIGNVKLDQDVNFTVDAYPGKTFRGKITQIRNLPKTSQSVVVYSTIITVHNEAMRLKPGMTANVSIVVAQRTASLRLPNAALRTRIPDQFLPPPPPAPSAETGATPSALAAPKAPADPAARREQMRQLFQDAGFSWGGGPPSPEVLDKLRKLAAERGLELPERFGGKPRVDAAPVARTLYRLKSGLPNIQLEAVTVKTGISDGSFTEVVEGVNEGDTIVSTIFIPGDTSSTSPAAASPFGGAPRRF